MIMERIDCPYCGGNLSEYRDKPVQICPYCHNTIYANDEGGHFTYTKVFIKEDKARIREAEAKEKIKLQQVAFEKEKYYEQSRKEENRRKWKIRLGIVAAFVIVLAGQNVFLNLEAQRREEKAYQQALVEQNTPRETVFQTDRISVLKSSLQATIASANELVSYKYFYTNLGETEKDRKLFKTIKLPFTTEKTLFTYDGVISAGYDLKSVDIDVDNKEKIITITLPKARILSHDIDTGSFQTYDIKKSVFTNVSIAEYTEFIDALKNNQEERLKSNEEFWSQVALNAQTSIKELITSSGASGNYSIKFK